jgi:hypothetical protein
MKLDNERRKFVAELNEFIKTLDENIRESAFKFLIGEVQPSSPASMPTPQPPKVEPDDRGISPQELIRQSNASSGVRKAEVLGYWLEVHQGKPKFSSGDLKEAFSLAREPAPKNMSDVAAQLAAAGKLMPVDRIGGVQSFRLTRTAIEEVEAWGRGTG